jgi:hypothetical protein
MLILNSYLCVIYLIDKYPQTDDLSLVGNKNIHLLRFFGNRWCGGHFGECEQNRYREALEEGKNPIKKIKMSSSHLLIAF